MRQLKISTSITQRSSDSVNKYITDISHIDMVDPREEALLCERIKKGDRAALTKLVNANLRFVISVAKKYHNASIDLADLIQEGNLGLLIAAQKFDSTKGFKFISYAVWWIRQSIMQYLSEHSGSVRLPANQIALMNKVTKFSAEYEQEHNCPPSVETIADAVGVAIEKVNDILGFNAKGLSIDAPLSDDSDSGKMSDFITSNLDDTDRGAIDEGLRTELDDILNKMDRAGDVLRLHYGIGCRAHTLEEIAAQMDITRERVRQLKMKGLHIIKSNANVMNVLKEYC